MTQIKVFTFNTVQENTYLLYDETGQAAIIDCGCMNSQEEAMLVTYCQEKGLTPKLLLNTHLHFDHAWGNAWALRQWSELKVYCHPKELTDQPLPSEQARLFGLNIKYEDVAVDKYLNIRQGDVLSFGNTSLEVREVPGHSPGHVVFYCGQAGAVIAGDTLFYEDIGRTDLWGGNYQQLISGIKEQMFTLPPETLVFTGHGDGTSIGHEINYNPYFK